MNIYLGYTTSFINEQQSMQRLRTGQSVENKVIVNSQPLFRWTPLSTPLVVSPRHRKLLGRKHKECKNQKTGTSAVKCCFLAMVQILYSETHSNCDYWHKVRPAKSEGTEFMKPYLQVKNS